ncbi:VanZ family protein [Agromyces sp. NPDC049794]|uniref:VanZ family protein n=1 Tax=unclassified Agromyces TaxID=2639701 RepID=UPI0033E38EEE
MTSGAELRMPRATPSSPDATQRGLLVGLFAVYLVLLVWLVLWKLEPPYVGDGALRHIKLVPFAPTTEDGASEPFEVIANLALFVPFGLYLGLLAPSCPWWKLAAVVAGSSLTLEILQYVSAVGSSDVTDLIVNTAGGMAGLGLVVLARRRLGGRTDTVMTRMCSMVTVLFLLAAGIFIASPMQYGPIPNVDLPVLSTPSDPTMRGPTGPSMGLPELRWCHSHARRSAGRPRSAKCTTFRWTWQLRPASGASEVRSSLGL